MGGFYYFIIYAVWQFADNSIYFLGYNHDIYGWMVHFEGLLLPGGNVGGYTFGPGAHNGNYSSTQFFIVSNDPPPEAKPPVANNGGTNWR